MTDFSPTDSLRYLYAQFGGTLDFISDRLAGWDDDVAEFAEAEGIQDMLDGIRAGLSEHLTAHTDNIVAYDDGRSVRTRATWEPNYSFEHVWHPDQAHVDNRPRKLYDSVDEETGVGHTMLVTPGENLSVHFHQGEPVSYTIAEAAAMLQAQGWVPPAEVA
jgi:hypothetical protein